MTSITPFSQETWAEESLLTIMLGGGRHAEKANSLCITLPSDLLLEICRHVEDIKTLKNLRLVNTIFAEFAIPALFNEVMFMLHPASIRKLRNIARSPHICKHVRRFAYIVDRFSDPYVYLRYTTSVPVWRHPKRKGIAIWDQFHKAQRTLLEHNQEALVLLWAFPQFQRMDEVSLLIFCFYNDRIKELHFPETIRKIVAAKKFQLEDLFRGPISFIDEGDDPLDATLDAMAQCGRPFESFELHSWNPDKLRIIDQAGFLRSYRPLLRQPLRCIRNMDLRLNNEQILGFGASTREERLVGLKEMLMIPTKLETFLLDVSVVHVTGILLRPTRSQTCINSVLSTAVFPHLKELGLLLAEVDVHVLNKAPTSFTITWYSENYSDLCAR